MIAGRVRAVACYLEGRETALLFGLRCLCPYEPHSDERNAWMRGFRHAEWEMGERIRMRKTDYSRRAVPRLRRIIRQPK